MISFGGRLPILCTNDGQTHLALLIDIRMVNLCLEADARRLEGILRGEIDFNLKRALVVGRIVRHNQALPCEDIGLIHLDVSEGSQPGVFNITQFL